MYKVLVAEDEELILNGIVSMIEWKEFDITLVHKAYDGIDALKMWKEENVDIIITDINMPDMDGLTFLKEIRKLDAEVRIIILSGYDDFEYARSAIGLDVEDYILKPIDDILLNNCIKKVVEKLNILKKKKKEVIDYHSKIKYFLEQKMGQKEKDSYIFSFQELNKKFIEVAVMKLSEESVVENPNINISDIIREIDVDESIEVIYLDKDELLIIRSSSKEEFTLDIYEELQGKLERSFGIVSFITIGTTINSVAEIPTVYKEAKMLQKYIVVEGYGRCINKESIRGRKSKDINVDEIKLNKMIVEKDKDGVVSYIEDLFINNYEKEYFSIEVIYNIAFKIGVILNNIIEEFHLGGNNIALNFLDQLYKAENISAIKSIFTEETLYIINMINKQDSKYTPVIRQILSEVEKNYREETSLKILAQRFNMNTSYLGRMFQKEVGCSYAQYVNNFRNSKGRDLILNTNMKITDIAKQLGYVETSYFYRKFKQSYGVSPASLRDIKNY